jgi:hypothetical protein
VSQLNTQQRMFDAAGRLTHEGYLVLRAMERRIDVLQADVAALQAAVADHEARLVGAGL